MRLFLCGAVFAALASGCYATTSTSVGYSGTVTATTVAPDLVYVSPGVQVIADYDEPVFYTDGYYWREVNGTWYRSSYHTHGWIYAAPPRTVISIENRHSYRRYRPAGYTPRRDRDYRDNRGVRDHRDRDHRTVRDNRDNRDWNRNDNRNDHRNDNRNDHRNDNRNWQQPTRDHDRRDVNDHRGTRQPDAARDNHRPDNRNWQQPTRDNRNDNRNWQQPTRDNRNDTRNWQQPTRDNRSDNKPNNTYRENRGNDRRDTNKRDDRRDRRR